MVIKMRKNGIIQVYTGNGKGKTTAAIGQAMRAIGHGWQVYLLQFMKGSKSYGEVKFAQQIPLFTLVQSGLETFVNKENPSAEDLRLANQGWNLAKEVIFSNKYQLVILDEINVALDYKLVPLAEVIQTLQEKPSNLDVILTGRYVPQEIVDLADLVSEIHDIKHHYYQGVRGRLGIEF
jgi:cob(I)alamin adenosyltransferase